MGSGSGFSSIILLVVMILVFYVFLLLPENRKKKKLNEMLSERTGQSLEVIEEATERDNFLSAEEALQFGLIDEIVLPRR